MEKLLVSYTALDMCVDGENAWFSNSSFNCICKMNLETLKTEVVAVFDNRPAGAYETHRKVIKKGNRLYFIPRKFDCIDVFDIGSGLQEHIYMPANTRAWIQISNAFLIQNKIYIMPYNTTDGVFVYDVDKNCFIEDEILSNKLKECNSLISYNSTCEYQDELWIIPFSSSKLLRYDINLGKIKMYNFDENSLYSVQVGSNVLIAKESTSDVYIFSKKEEKIVGRIYSTNAMEELFLHHLFFPIYWNNEIFYLSKNKGDSIIRGNGYNNIPLGSYYSDLPALPFSKIIGYKDKAYIIPYMASNIVELDLTCQKVRIVEWKCDILGDFSFDVCSLGKDLLSRGVLEEKYLVGINEFINLINIKH